MFTNKLQTNTIIKGLIMLCFVAITQLVSAQQGFNYKAILKDTDGNVLSNTYMTVLFSIHQNTASGAVVYQEDHNYTTDANGLVILNIGTDTTPSIGDFSSIEWGQYAHFLQTSITYSGGTINFDATEFMAVPYAKHAATAEVAENVFSGDYNDLINQPNTIPAGLETINEGNGIGWRLIGVNPEDYGSIGYSAVDLSISHENSDLYGATGYASFAMGVLTEASGQYTTAMGLYSKALGEYSTALGSSTIASGNYSTAMGGGTEASGYNSIAMGSYSTALSSYETAIGRYTTNSEPLNTSGWNPNDRLFVIGNGTSDTNRSDALTVLKNGNTTFNAEVQTKNTGSAHMLPIAYGLVESNGNILNGTGNFTASKIGNVFTLSINNETFDHNTNVCFITPISGGFRTSSISSSGGNVVVRVFDSSGNTTSTSFQFMVYKL